MGLPLTEIVSLRYSAGSEELSDSLTIDNVSSHIPQQDFGEWYITMNKKLVDGYNN